MTREGEKAFDSSSNLYFPCTDLESAEEMEERGGKGHVPCPLQVPQLRSGLIGKEWGAVEAGSGEIGEGQSLELDRRLKFCFRLDRTLEYLKMNLYN